MQVSFAKSVHE